jgi:uncharacterized protein (DUF952 family)
VSVIYHIAPQADWERAQADGAYTADSLADEGFIHCSTATQHAEVANRIFAGRTDLMLLLIDTDRLSASVLVEGGYPHIYGAVDLDAVIDVHPYRPDGAFTRHDESWGWDTFGALTLEALKARVTDAIASYTRPWFVAGGWALDLHLGRRTRPHADIEISVLRADQQQLRAHLGSADLRLPMSGAFQAWDGGEMPSDYHQIWTRAERGPDDDWRSFCQDPTHLDFLLENSDDDRWTYRRDARITLPLEEFGMRTTDGVPYVRPAIALLYKAKAARRKDQHDFNTVLPSLDADERKLLASFLDAAHPGHPWLEELA